MRRAVGGLLTLLLIPVSLSAAEDPIFSGPQVGEKMTPFPVRGVFDDDAGKELDFIKEAKGKPTLLIFVHELTRPSVGVTRTLMNYTAKRKKDGLYSGLVFLFDDLTEGENRLKRARHALPKETPVGISPDGKEGPGSYGLNRNVTLTVLVAEKNKVTANFALVQPSVQADVPKILEEIIKLVGGEVPSLAQLGAVPRRPKAKKKQQPEQDPNLRRLIRPVIQKTATPEEVDNAAGKLEKYLAKHPKTKIEVGNISRRIIEAGKLEDYGTKRAQEFLQKWAKEYKPKRERESKK